jgi:CRP/FNR family transcriptional regulator, cyclic AMP receptor protein
VEWALLAGLDERDREQFLGLTRRRSFAKNEVVCHQGDMADSLHLVETGHLAVRGTLESGETATFNVLAAGDCFGELALLRQDLRRTATVVALESTTTLAVAATSFRRLCADKPQVERALSTLLAARVDQLSRRLLDTMYLGLDRRVFRMLVQLASTYESAGDSVSIPLPQTALADLVGATRPSVNQVLQRLAQQDLLELQRGRVVILDLPALIRRSGL